MDWILGTRPDPLDWNLDFMYWILGAGFQGSNSSTPCDWIQGRDFIFEIRF